VAGGATTENLADISEPQVFILTKIYL